MDKDQVFGNLKYAADALYLKDCPGASKSVALASAHLVHVYAELESLRIERAALADHNVKLMGQVRRAEQLANDWFADNWVDDDLVTLNWASGKLSKALEGENNG